MAQRPVYIPMLTKESYVLYDEVYCEFHWFPGYSIDQKQKSIGSLHSAAKSRKIRPILEISSKSSDPNGVKLSAFNLYLDSFNYGRITVESAFQGSKRFLNGGPYIDLYGKSGREIKKDHRLKDSGSLVCFDFEGISWKLKPVTAFYDWLYIRALHDNLELRDYVMEFNGFTDIEFNPKKSINCQAKSCALYVSLRKREILNEVIDNRNSFIKLLKKGNSMSDTLFE